MVKFISKNKHLNKFEKLKIKNLYLI